MACDRSNYDKVIEVPVDMVKAQDHVVLIDLVEPGNRPRSAADLLVAEIIHEQIDPDTVPNIVIRIAKQAPLVGTAAETA
jgi:hypothetical protein